MGRVTYRLVVTGRRRLLQSPGITRDLGLGAPVSQPHSLPGSPTMGSAAGLRDGVGGTGRLMLDQLKYLEVHRPALGVFEQVPRFRQLKKNSNYI